MSKAALKLAEKIRQTGRRSPEELIPLIDQAEKQAASASDSFTRGVYVRAAGNAHQLLNNFTAALEHYNSAIELFEGTNDSAQNGRTLLAKVGLLLYLSRYDELFDCARTAREVFEQSGDESSLARLDVNLGNAYHRLDKYQEALDCYERAFPTLDQGEDREGLLAASLNAGVVLTALHRFDTAEHRYDRALEVARELDMYAIELQCRYNRTYLDYLKGNSGRALREMADLRREFGRRADDRHVCLCWLDEAEILLEIGDLSESIRSAERARELGRTLSLNYEIGKTMLFEAVASLRLGQDDDAGTLLEGAVERFQAEGNNVWIAVSRLQAALFRGEQGNPLALAEAASARALLEDRKLPDRLALADIVIGRLQRAAGDDTCARDSFESAVRLAEESESAWMQFHAYHELGMSMGDDGVGFLCRAESMLDSLWHRLGSDDLKMAFLTDRDSVYTHLVSNVVEQSTEEAFRLSERARSRVLVERLARSEVQVPASEIPARLDQDETIVEYFIAGNDLHIFTINRNSLECVHWPGAVPRIRDEWAHLERHFASCSVKWEQLSRIADRLEVTALTHLGRLYDELIAPVVERLRGTAVVVPHGFLHGIPFQALYDGSDFLMSRCALVYSPAAALYLEPSEEVSDEPPLFVAFSTNAKEDIVGEVEQAAARFPDSLVLINPSLGELSEQMSRYRPLLHMAGHAGIDPIRGSLSWLETAEGRLTSRDLMDMRFRAGTVVVTGCHTARRNISAGDEWMGLMRAFYLSGAHTIVSAFWAVRDEAAHLFSKIFYENYDGTNAAAAVSTASAAIRRSNPHPYFWSGFGTFVRKPGGIGHEL